MNTMEDRARAAMRAVAATVGDVAPPLRLAPAPGAPDPAAGPPSRKARRARRWRTWVAPVMAAVAMLAIGISLAVVRHVPDGRVLSPATPPLSHGVPRYYVALDGPTGDNPAPAKVVVGDTVTGRRLLTLGPFAGGGAVSVTAAADGLTFVVGAGHYRAPAPPAPTAWYLIHITPGPPVSATVRALPLPASASGWAISTALSPDGTELAMIGDPGGQTVLRIYSVATGAVLRTWAEPRPGGATLWFPGTLWWTNDGRTLAWGYSGAERAETFGVWLLQVTRPGHNLVADSRLAWSTQVLGSFDPNRVRSLSCAGVGPSVLVTGDGKTIVCGAWGVLRAPGNLPNGTCPKAPPWNDEGFLEYSAATGKLARTLYRASTSCVIETDPTQVLWASATGGTMIGFFYFDSVFPEPTPPVIRFGVYRDHTFTPLPVPPSTDAGTIAW